MIILIDLDGPIADFETGFLNEWKRKFPGCFFAPTEKRRSFYIKEDYPEELREKVDEIYHNKNFILNLPIAPNSLEAIKEMVSRGLDVRICSSPLSNYKNCVGEKYQWVENNLGFDFTKKIILTKDKTLIKGDYLIDDNPTIDGITKPEWEHLLYDCPQNKQFDGKRINWLNWKDILKI